MSVAHPLCSELVPTGGVELSALELTLRPLRPHLERDDVTELCINRPGELFLETVRGWECTSAPFADFDWCQRLARLIANLSSQRIDATAPLLSAALPSGERAQVVLPPATTTGCVALTLRRPAAQVWSVDELTAGGAFAATRAAGGTDTSDAELGRLHAARDYPAFLRLAVRARKNIIVTGGVDAGKTTLLRA
ncbi:MAG: Flp pilus assembly complex ATPase component TadA, partial [Gammaproteobacteria bacterium]|nr:Flp pilus assembly complex ATPase component TadA [Gammaproteobacteria bacterium]